MYVCIQPHFHEHTHHYTHIRTHFLHVEHACLMSVSCLHENKTDDKTSSNFCLDFELDTCVHANHILLLVCVYRTCRSEENHQDRIIGTGRLTLAFVPDGCKERIDKRTERIYVRRAMQSATSTCARTLKKITQTEEEFVPQQTHSIAYSKATTKEMCVITALCQRQRRKKCLSSQRMKRYHAVLDPIESNWVRCLLAFILCRRLNFSFLGQNWDVIKSQSQEQRIIYDLESFLCHMQDSVGEGRTLFPQSSMPSTISSFPKLPTCQISTSATAMNTSRAKKAKKMAKPVSNLHRIVSLHPSCLSAALTIPSFSKPPHLKQPDSTEYRQ